jgi:hypothetical protein
MNEACPVDDETITSNTGRPPLESGHTTDLGGRIKGMKFEIGDRVVINEGPFAAHSAIVVALGESEEEVVVETEVFDRTIQWRLLHAGLLPDT